MAPSAPALDIRGLSVRYPLAERDALEDISLAIEPGAFLSVAGRNGAGKSTLALAAAGLLPRVVRATASGSISVAGVAALDDGRDVAAVPAGLVLADPAVGLSGARATVREEVAFGLENLGIERDAMDDPIDRALAALQIDHLAERPPETLSGGEQQRVAIASVIAMGLPLLVLDEAAAELDAAATAALADHLATVAREGVAILAAEHAAAVLERAERTLVLEDGIPVAFDAPAAALAFPALPASTPIDAAWDPGTRVEATGIELSGVSYRYPSGVDALREVTLSIEPGQAVAVVGGNGSGKSTLARALAGLLAPDAGSVIAGGPVGTLLQDPREQLFGRTVERAVAFGPRNLGLPAAVVDHLAEAAITAAGLADRRRSNPHDLDLAARKQVALAGVLAMDPAVLVLDEPTTGQDRPGLQRLEDVLRAARAAGRTIVAITHDLELAARAFDRVIVLRDGEVIGDGAPGTMLAPERADLLASTGLRPVVTAEGRLADRNV